MGEVSQELLRAWRQLEAYDREEDVYYDAFEKMVFNHLLYPNLRVIEWLMDSAYSPFPFFVMHVPKKNGFRQKVWTTPQDGLIAQAWLNRCGEALERKMPLESLGYRLENGDGDRIFRPWQNAYHTYRAKMDGFTFLPDPCHFIKTDLSNFYPSVDLDLLEAELGRYIPHPPELVAIREFIRYRILDPNTGVVEGVERGVAQGPPYARVLANVYLTKLDSHLRKTALTYARYVDDFVALYRTKDDADRQMSQLDWLLEDLKLTRNIDKTTGPAPVDDESLLLDEVMRMRSEAEDFIKGVEYLDAGAQKEKLAQGLYTYFARVSGDQEKDLLSAAKWLSFILRNQQRLGASPSILQKTVSSVQTVLEAGLQNVKTLRSIFRSLLLQGQGDLPTPGLHRAILRADDHAKIAFCEVCGVLNVNDQVFSTLEKLSGDAEQPLVRAAAITAFCLHNRKVPDDLINLCISSDNSFLRARALLCLRASPNTDVYPYLVPHVQSGDAEVVVAALMLMAKSRQAASYLLLQQVPIHAFKRAESISLYAETALSIGRLEALSRLHIEAGVPHDVLGDVLRLLIARTDDLAVLVGVLQDSARLPDEIRNDIMEFVGYRLQALYPNPSNRPPEVASWLSAGGTGHGWLQADPRLAGIRSAHIRYLCAQGGKDWSPQERIPVRRLPSGISPEDWVLQMRSALGESLCDFEWHVESGPTGQILVLTYQIPDGFRLLAEVLKLDGAIPIGKTVCILKGMANLATQAVPLDPFHVLINADMDFRLFGAGGSLEAATYSGSSASTDDMSPAANIRFLGLLAFHMATGTCPLAEETEIGRSRSGSRLLVTSPRLENYPHLKLIIGKCVEPDYRERYASAKILIEDLDSAHRFLLWKESGFAGSLPADLTSLEQLHAIGLQVKHMLASETLARQGSVLHAERVVSHVLLGLTKLSWRQSGTPRRRHARSARPAGRILQMYFDVQKQLNDIFTALDTAEWEFVKRVAGCVAYWALRIEIGRFLRSVVEPNDLSRLRFQIEAASSELLAERVQGRSLRVELTDDALVGDPSELAELEMALRACERTDHHKYDCSLEDGLRTCALLFLLSACDGRFVFEYAEKSVFVEATRLRPVRAEKALVEMVAQRLWNLQSMADMVLSCQPVSPEAIDVFSNQCWELIQTIERVVRRPRFTTHLARSKGPGEMGSYIRLLNSWLARPYQYNHLANIDPETERPVPRDTTELVEVDLSSWTRPVVTAVLFEPLLVRTVLGKRPNSWQYRAARLITRHAPTGVPLTLVFCVTLYFVCRDQQNVFSYLVGGLCVNLLSILVDKGITVLLGRKDVD